MSDNQPVTPNFQSAAEIADLVRRFEDCTLTPADFSHCLHLTVALWYLAHAPLAEAAARVRQGLLRFIAHHQAGDKYHETITLFWLKLVQHYLKDAGAERPLPELANELCARFGDSRLIFAHYSQALIQTPDAKANWVEPDLRPLVF